MVERRGGARGRATGSLRPGVPPPPAPRFLLSEARASSDQHRSNRSSSSEIGAMYTGQTTSCPGTIEFVRSFRICSSGFPVTACPPPFEYLGATFTCHLHGYRNCEDFFRGLPGLCESGARQSNASAISSYRRTALRTSPSFSLFTSCSSRVSYHTAGLGLTRCDSPLPRLFSFSGPALALGDG